MQLVSFATKETPSFFSSKWTVRHVPLVAILRSFLSQYSVGEKQGSLSLLEEDELPHSLFRLFEKTGLRAPDSHRFLLHDRNPLRLSIVAAPKRLEIRKEEHQELMQSLASLVRSTGKESREFALLSLLDASDADRLSFRPLCALLWCADPLWGEARLQKSLPKALRRAHLPELTLANETKEPSFSHTEVTDDVRPKTSVEPLRQEPRLLKEDAGFSYTILGNKASPQSRKYFLREEENGLRLAVFCSPKGTDEGTDAWKAAVGFVKLTEQGHSLLGAHRALLSEALCGKDSRNMPSCSMSLELTRKGRFQCINHDMPALLWRNDEHRCHILPTSLRRTETGLPQVCRLEGRLGDKDGLLLLAGMANREELRALARTLQLSSKSGSGELIERALSRKLDELGLGRAFWFSKGT